MVEKSRLNILRDHIKANVTIHLEDLQDTVIGNASLVVMHFTLQFIADEKRSTVLKQIADGVNSGEGFDPLREN